MVADLENNMLSGLMLVVLVMLVALGLRNALLVSMAIPFSMFLTFSVLHALGITLNMVVLYSLTLALGMLVDNAIVIIENIHRYMEQGVPKLQAAKRATAEVAYPVIGSTATTLAAFAPMMFWPGIMGEFMKYLPLTLIITLTSSLFVAMIINPALAAVFMKSKKAGGAAATPEQIAAAGEKPVDITSRYLKAYTAVLGLALRHRITVVLISFAVLVLLVQVWLVRVGLEKPVEFFPDIDPKSVYINLDMPEGADLDYTDRVLRAVEKKINGFSKDSPYGASYRLQTHKKALGVEFQGPDTLTTLSTYTQRPWLSPPPGAPLTQTPQTTWACSSWILTTA